MNFSQEIIDAVWAKAQTVDGFDENKYRKDVCGAWMIKDSYGDKESIYGWEIDHICPVSILKERNISEEVINNLSNLRALQWENNRRKDNSYPDYISAVTSEENKNIKKERSLSVNEKTKAILKQLYGL